MRLITGFCRPYTLHRVTSVSTLLSPYGRANPQLPADRTDGESTPTCARRWEETSSRRCEKMEAAFDMSAVIWPETNGLKTNCC